MTWAQTPGEPHGGPLPTPVVNDLSVRVLSAGDALVITGTGFTPGSLVIAQPGSKVLAVSSPTDTTTITTIVPYDLPNVKHMITVTNGNQSNAIELFVVRDVTITPSLNTTTDITLVEAN